MIDDLSEPSVLADLQRDHATETPAGCVRGATVIATAFCALAYALVATAAHCHRARPAPAPTPIPAAAHVRSALVSPSTDPTDGA